MKGEQEALTASRADFAQKRATKTENHPSVIRARREMETLEARVRDTAAELEQIRRREDQTWLGRVREDRDQIVRQRRDRLVLAKARVGFSGDYGGTFFLSQLVGQAKARQLYFLSERVTADEALALGLTNWVCEPEELEEKTMEIVKRAHVCAVNSIVSELRANGIAISCRRDRGVYFYRLGRLAVRRAA